MNNLLNIIIHYVILFIVFAFSISLHECAHAYAAYRLGDSTAKDQGRITLNPKKHLDPLGTLMIFLIGFGWAKPTPVNAMYFENRKKGVMISSFAGPLSNFLFAVILAFPLLYLRMNLSSLAGVYILKALESAFNINVILAIFNMLPIPPLDGSKILSGILPPRYYYKMLEYQTYIMIAFVILMFTGILGNYILWPLVSKVEGVILFIASAILGVFG